MNRILLSFLLLFILINISAQTQVIAHRGFWDVEGSAKNSVSSLIKADSIGCYGSEFDVRMTKDGQLVVIHDLFYKGRKISKTSANKLTKLKLANGETIPFLSEYLKEGAKLNTQLILELKKLGNSKKETKAIQMIIEMVKEYGLEERIEYISFSQHAVKEFIRLSPKGTPVFYLKGDLSPEALKRIGCSGPDYESKVFRKYPEWITESQRLGMKVNVWTVNQEEDFKWFLNQKVDFITTNNPLLLQQLISDQ